MHYRKIIRFGKSSFVVTLPLSWIRKHNLTKGSILYCSQKDNELSYTPSQKQEKLEKTKVVEIKNQKFNKIETELVSAYINNYHKIKFIGTKLHEHTSQIKKKLYYTEKGSFKA